MFFQDLGSIVSGGWLQTEEPTGRVELESASSGWTAFHIGQASPDMTAEGAIPKWLDIHPASGYLPPHVCHPPPPSYPCCINCLGLINDE